MNLSQIGGGTLEHVVQRLQSTIARINTVWAREHQSDGRHILPKWYDMPYAPSTYASPSGWAVEPKGVETHTYWKHGDCLCVAFAVNGLLAGADNEVTMRLPENFVSAGNYVNPAIIYAGGGAMAGFSQVTSQSRQLKVVRTDLAPMTPGTVVVYGQILLRTTV